MKLFGSSGIRGVTNKDVTVDLALKVGMALGLSCKSAVVGRDPRIAGEMIEQAIISGLLSSGCDVVKVGMVSTPTLAYMTRDYDCGVMVTASHNPAEYVGIKLWNPDGMAFDSKQQTGIEECIGKEAFKPVKWNLVGRLSESSDAIRAHKERILSLVKPSSTRVVIDCGCGAGSSITPYVLREMGCEVITLNSQADGYFPARNPEPNDANLELLKKAVVHFQADIGIAQDGDADRMMAVDENGEFVTGDEMLAIFALSQCNEGSTLVAPVDTSMMVDDALPSSKVIRTRVGDVYVAEKIKEHRAAFGGEPSGSWIFPDISYCPDGIYASAKIVEMTTQASLSKLKSTLPHYPTIRGTIACPDEKKAAVMETLQKRLHPLGTITDIDGIRLETGEGWLLIRPSGTEPKIRITAEARENTEELFEMGEKAVMEALS